MPLSTIIAWKSVLDEFVVLISAWAFFCQSAKFRIIGRILDLYDELAIVLDIELTGVY